MGRETQVKVTNINKNKLCIIGDNVLYNNGIITAFYIIPLTNYATNSDSGIEFAVKSLTNMITNLTTNNPTITFTIESIEKKIKRKDVIKNLLDTISIYRPDYEMPLAFTKNIRDDDQTYCILGIDVQQSTVTDVEDKSIWETIKEVSKDTINKFTSLGNINVDPEQILKIEEDIYRTINSRCMRATKEVVFYTYVSKLFPNYIISYDKISYINENNFEAIMGAVTQTVSDNFGWFELHNEGVDIFGLEPQTTYGCMLDVHSFPIKIDSCNFPLDCPGSVVTTIKCMKKEDATVKIKRIRAADRYEVNQAIEAGAEIEDIEATQENIDIATKAIQDLESGEILCEFNTSILIYATSREELKKNIMEVITSFKDRNILAAKSLTQAADFLNNYVNKKPKKFLHIAPLAFPLSFQQNSGATVGDIEDRTPSGQPIWSPAIGEDIV